MKIVDLPEIFNHIGYDIHLDLEKLENNKSDEYELLKKTLVEILNESSKRSEFYKSFKKKFETIKDGIPSNLDIVQAAAFLKIGVTALNEIKNKGDIKFHKIGGSIRFTFDDLYDYLSMKIFENYALCFENVILIDKQTKELSLFLENRLYRILGENKIWIYILDLKLKNRIKIGKKEFRKYFRIAKQLDIDAAKFNLGNHFG